MDDILTFADENHPKDLDQGPPWKILIADDEPSVHLVTKLALGDFTFEGRRLELLSAYGEDDTRRLLAEHPDIALILLDVVMDTMDSGFDLVRYIRDDLKNKDVRIIMRTGQSGNAPEDRIIINYDINDFKDKTELTVAKLRTTMISSLRTYSHLRIIAAEQHKATASRAYLHSVIDSLSSVLIAVDDQARVLLWNREAERWTGTLAAAAVGQKLFDIAPLFGPLEGLFQEARQGPPGHRVERTAVPLWKGEQVFVHLTVQNLAGTHGPEVLFRLDDRTLARLRDEQSARSQKVSSFGQVASEIAKELTRALASPDAGPPERAEGLRRASGVLARLARFSEIESSHGEPVDWRALVKDRIAGHPVPEGRQIVLVTDGPGAWVGGGRPGLETVVDSLFDNALEARSMTVEVLFDERDLDEVHRARHPGCTPGRYWALTVRDHGVGMGAESLRQAFDPGYTTKPTGLGLGLTLVHNIVEGLGGYVELFSTPGAGTEVLVALPAWKAPEAPAQEGLILLCDDEPLMRQVASRILRHHGYRVIEAQDGPETLELLELHGPALTALILDLVLPGTSGLEIFRRVHAQRPTLPVILSSGFGRGEIVDQALAEGVSGFLQKPYRADSLTEAVRLALGQRSG